MRTLLYHDGTLNIDLAGLIDELAILAPTIGVRAGVTAFPHRDDYITANSYDNLPANLAIELDRCDLGMLLTARPYDNNFFWVMNGNHAFFSFAGWSDLTDAPLENGIALFLASKVLDIIGAGYNHDDNTGCINDFLWDKAFVDVLLRSAYMCAECRARVAFDDADPAKQHFDDALRILDVVGESSRKGVGVVTYLRSARPASVTFDTFLCHNSRDKPAVRVLSTALVEAGLHPWLDEEQLQPGRVWQVQLEQEIESVASALVLVGPAGLGPWQDMEQRAFLEEFKGRGCPVIPVILPGTTDVPQLPMFLRQFMWVDMRQAAPDPVKQLVWGITGKRPA